MSENGLIRQYVESLHPRLADFEETRLEAMNETGIELCVSGSVDPGI